jgi:hypothetical protein
MHSAFPVHGVRAHKYAAHDVKPNAPNRAINPKKSAAVLAIAIYKIASVAST